VFTQLCREYGISTKTGYKWRERFLEQGYAGLEEESRMPRSNGKALAEWISVELLRIKKKHEAWGAAKILNIYERNHPGEHVPARSTVEHLSDQRSADGAGRGGINADSKFILGIGVAEKGDISHVKAVFERLFKEYGLPEYIRSDNGPPFASRASVWGLTKLSVWWMTLGIKLDRDDPGCPYQNGGHERMHRDMTSELEGQIDGSLNEHQRVFDAWRKEFNTERPHQALGMKRPAEVYRKSGRKYISEKVELEYGRGMKGRMANDRGWCNFHGRLLFIGNPFSGYRVGLKERAGKQTEVWFGNFLLGEIISATGQIAAQGSIIQQKPN
jgi:transposase InsO family protein